MDYHRRSAEGASGTPILPTSTTPPDTAALPPAASASAATAWDRLETDIRALKQQALATQKSIQQLQTHEAPDPLQTLQSALPSLPGGLDGTAVGVAAGLGLTLALVWWALWVRPQSRLRQSDDYPAPDHSNIAPLQRTAQAGTGAGLAPLEPTEPTAESAASDSLFARHDPNLGFDSEAAASEVIRVRKSLAEKREARSLQRDNEDTTLPLTPQVRAWLDPSPPPAPEPLPPVIDITTAEPMADLDLDLGLESEPEPSLSLELEHEPTPPPAPEPVPGTEPEAPEWPDTDFGITLALAQESEALDLWPEARELATEVLESQAPELRDQAMALLARLDAREQARAQEAEPPPDTPADPTSA